MNIELKDLEQRENSLKGAAEKMYKDYRELEQELKEISSELEIIRVLKTLIENDN